MTEVSYWLLAVGYWLLAISFERGVRSTLLSLVTSRRSPVVGRRSLSLVYESILFKPCRGRAEGCCFV